MWRPSRSTYFVKYRDGRRTYRNVGQRYSRAGSSAIMDTRENASDRARVILTSAIVPPDTTLPLWKNTAASSSHVPSQLSACLKIFRFFRIFIVEKMDSHGCFYLWYLIFISIFIGSRFFLFLFEFQMNVYLLY